MSIVAEAHGFLQVFSDGSVKRFSPEIVFPSLEFDDGYKSKDIVIDPLRPITGRIFLPNIPSNNKKLPIVVYFHGGGFCIGSTTWFGYHVFLGKLAVKTGAIILSIDYRHAPENRLPIAYFDAYTSLKWLVDNQDTDSWLKQANLSHLFVSGDSAGGNIAHNVVIEVIKNKSNNNVQIKGILLIHPFFGSEIRSPKEVLNEEVVEVKMNDMFWNLSIPKGSNRDYFGCNFEMVQLSEDEWGQFPKVVVYVAELDFLMERGVMYVEHMKKKGVKSVKLIEAKDENHVFHVYHPFSQPTHELQQQMTEFINS